MTPVVATAEITQIAVIGFRAYQTSGTFSSQGRGALPADEILPGGAGEIKVADMGKGERTLGSLTHASAPTSAVRVSGCFDAQAGFRSAAKPTQRAIDTRAKLPRIMNIVG